MRMGAATAFLHVFETHESQVLAYLKHLVKVRCTLIVAKKRWLHRTPKASRNKLL